MVLLSCLSTILSLIVLSFTSGIHTILHGVCLIVNDLWSLSAKALNRRQLEEWPAPLFVYSAIERLSDLHGPLFWKGQVSRSRGKISNLVAYSFWHDVSWIFLCRLHWQQLWLQLWSLLFLLYVFLIAHKPILNIRDVLIFNSVIKQQKRE